MVLFGSIWFHLVLFGSIWLYMVLALFYDSVYTVQQLYSSMMNCDIIANQILIVAYLATRMEVQCVAIKLYFDKVEHSYEFRTFFWHYTD